MLEASPVNDRKGNLVGIQLFHCPTFVCKSPFEAEITPKALLLLMLYEEKDILLSPALRTWKKKVCWFKNGEGK